MKPALSGVGEYRRANRYLPRTTSLSPKQGPPNMRRFRRCESIGQWTAMLAWHRGQRERNGRGRGRRALECRRSRNEWGHTVYLGGREIRIRSRECGAPKVLLCFVHCWRAVERRAVRAYCFFVASAKRSAVRCVSTLIGNGLMERRSPLL
jgi:hypothetical protein